MQRISSMIVSKPKDASADPFAADAPQAAILYREAVANPSPLGLFAFGLTAILMATSNAMLTEGTAAHHRVACFGLFYGGFAQILAAIYEIKRGSTFGAITFYTYGGYWVGLAIFFLFADGDRAADAAARAVGPHADAAVNGLYCVLSLAFLGGSLRTNRATQAIFFGLATLYFLLTLGSFFPVATRVAGFWGMGVGSVGLYTGLAELYNEVYGRVVLPLGTVGGSAAVAAVGAPTSSGMSSPQEWSRNKESIAVGGIAAGV